MMKNEISIFVRLEKSCSIQGTEKRIGARDILQRNQTAYHVHIENNAMVNQKIRELLIVHCMKKQEQFREKI